MTRKQISDERWAAALARADEGDLSELVKALFVVAPVPDWVREDYNRSPLAELSDEDRRLLWAFKDYYDDRQLDEKKVERIKRIAKIYRVTDEALENLVNRKGRAYDDWKRCCVTATSCGRRRRRARRAAQASDCRSDCGQWRRENSRSG